MNQGQLVEYGEPYKLLEREGSWFKSLYEETSRNEGFSGNEDVIEFAQ